jgi:hypothetical protein
MSTYSHVLIEKDGIRSPGRFEISWSRWSLALEIIYDGGDGGDGDDWPWMLHAHILLLNLFVHFPIRYVPPSKREPYEREWQHWGFTCCEDSVHIHWNEWTKVCWLPWLNKVFQRHEVRRAGGSWTPFVGSWERDKVPDGREEFTLPYTYHLRSGEVQDRTATVFVERRAWRPKWFTWTSMFEKSRQTIDVRFSDEIGERTGSWKGGCVGCGWDMLPKETAEQTLRRMERERIFR